MWRVFVEREYWPLKDHFLVGEGAAERSESHISQTREDHTTHPNACVAKHGFLHVPNARSMFFQRKINKDMTKVIDQDTTTTKYDGN